MGTRTGLNKQWTRQLLLGVLSVHVNLLVSSARTSTDTGPVFLPTLPLPQLVPRQNVEQPCLDPHCGITLAPSHKNPSSPNTLESPITPGDIQDMEYIYRGHIGRVTKNLDNLPPPATPSYRIVQVQPMEHIMSKRAAKFRQFGSSLTKVSPPSNLVYTHTTRMKEQTTNKLNRSVKFGQWKEDGEEMAHWSQNSLVSFDAIELCSNQSKLVSPHPDNCAWYINCSITPDAAMLTYFNGYILECPYPQLFSETTLQCEDFNDVQCQGRFEPKSPCEYRSNKCHESSHCVPCWVRYASCRGLSEGLNPWQGMEWEPFFVECHRERTVFQGLCDSSAVFSPITRACETPMSIPSKHGGWKPGCNGRRDGLYPDELGRCDLYYTCQGQLFRGFHSCQHGLKFNPFSSSCQPVREVPFPCGDNEGDMQLCKGKQNGNFLDVFGRCTHYFSCENQTMAGFHVCSRGIYNTEKQRCDVNDADRSSLPAPCGELTNECLKRPDGIYEDKKDMRTKCARQIVCERGLVISSRFSCGSTQ